MIKKNATILISKDTEEIQLLESDIKTLTQNNANEGEVFFFFSYDLSNSTLLKDKFPEGWLRVNKTFYATAKNELYEAFKDDTDQPKIWRTRGDEIIFCKEVYEIKNLFEYTERAFNVLKKIKSNLEKYEKEYKPILSVKACCWIANVYEDVEKTSKENENIPRNIIMKEPSSFDFLGPDIDLGFRISKHVTQGNMVICAKLAQTLISKSSSEESNQKNLNGNLRLVSFETLTGVWGSRQYPIIWYCDNWDAIKTNFRYDEEFSSPIIKKIIDNKEIKKFDTKDNEKLLYNIFEDLGREKELEEIINIINKSKDNKTVQYCPIPSDLATEVHLTATCFTSDKKILLGKRVENKSLGGKWQFGCANLKFRQSFSDCLKDTYKKDFGIEIEVYQEKPISTFGYKEKKVQGIRFIAKIIEPMDISLDKTNHSASKMFDVATINSIDENEYIPGFKNTVELSLEAYEEWTKNEE